MVYQYITFIVIGILFHVNISAIQLDYNSDLKILNPLDNFNFNPENITIKDDAFHLSKNFFHIETWYFDAKFENNYTIVIVISMFKTGLTGYLIHGFYLYNASKLETLERKISFLKNIEISYDFPYLKINNDKKIYAIIDDCTGDWIYSIKFKNDNHGVDLKLTKTANGWMGDHPLGWWLSVPRFNVKGRLIIDNKEINVKGEGYHDHNIYPVYIPFLMEGYHFGGFGGEYLHITWARFLNKNNPIENIAILSQGDMNFSIIHPDEIFIKIEDEKFDNGKCIPLNFTLKIVNERININISMDTIDLHCINLHFIKYWRYHMRITGNMSVDNRTEFIEKIEINELLTFF